MEILVLLLIFSGIIIFLLGHALFSTENDFQKEEGQKFLYMAKHNKASRMLHYLQSCKDGEYRRIWLHAEDLLSAGTTFADKQKSDSALWLFERMFLC